MKNSQTTIRNKNPKWQFPDFEVVLINKKNSNYCVCVFVINEGERIQKQLKKMKKYTDIIDVVVADGGSTDGSLDEGFLRSQSVRALLTKKGKGKLSAQMRMAFAWALHEGYEGVVVVDGTHAVRVVVVLGVFNEGTEFNSVENIGLLFSGEAVALGVTTTFDIEDVIVGPHMLVISDQGALRIT